MPRMFDRRQKINLACALVCAGMLGYAIYAEKYLGYVPCPLCMFQRVCIGALGLVFLIEIGRASCRERV